MGKLFLLTTFVVITPLFLLITILFYTYYSYLKTPSSYTLSLFGTKPTVSYAALPTSPFLLKEYITEEDSRVEMLRQFFEQYDSPLEPYAEFMVVTAEKYELDFRLLPAIAMQESNLCRRMPKDSHNCWGFGIYGGKVTRFSSYEEAIETVAKALGKKYKGKLGLESPEEIVTRYTPSDNGKWTNGVTFFMNKLQ